MLKTVFVKFFKLINRIKPSGKTILYHSFPDFSDNSFAMFLYNYKHQPEYKKIWLVDAIEKKETYYRIAKNYGVDSSFTILKKKSLKAFFHYVNANFVFHTHGLFNFFGSIKKHKKVNLWHGMPIKKIGYLDTEHSKVLVSNYHTATSDFYQDIIARAFGALKETVFISGQTRNDLLLKPSFSLNAIFNKSQKFNKTILWMPTYRKSVVGDIRIDGNINPKEDFLDTKKLTELNLFLKTIQSICYIKIHPMDYRKKTDFLDYSNINILDNNDFDNQAINMYSVLSSVDVLLTDFSSIYIDFLLLNKPIGFVFSDFNEFSNSRGFIFDNPKDYMPGKIVTTNNELISFLKELFIDNKDSFKEDRNRVKQIFHANENDFSKLTFQKIKNVK